jgi:hypothetical protein
MLNASQLFRAFGHSSAASKSLSSPCLSSFAVQICIQTRDICIDLSRNFPSIKLVSTRTVLAGIMSSPPRDPCRGPKVLAANTAAGWASVLGSLRTPPMPLLPRRAAAPPPLSTRLCLQPPSSCNMPSAAAAAIAFCVVEAAWKSHTHLPTLPPAPRPPTPTPSPTISLATHTTPPYPPGPWPVLHPRVSWWQVFLPGGHRGPALTPHTRLHPRCTPFTSPPTRPLRALPPPLPPHVR